MDMRLEPDPRFGPPGGPILWCVEVKPRAVSGEFEGRNAFAFEHFSRPPVTGEIVEFPQSIDWKYVGMTVKRARPRSRVLGANPVCGRWYGET